RLAGAADMSQGGIGFLLYLMLDEIVDGYLDVIELFEDLADDIEDDVATEEDGGEGETMRVRAHGIFRLRQQVVRFRRLASPMREVVDLLIETPRLVTAPLTPYFRDVMDH